VGRTATRRLALVVAAFTLSLAFAELSVRTFGLDAPRADLGVVPHPRWHHWHRANHTFEFRVAAEGYSVPVHFNAHGMRDSRSITQDRSPGTLRIAVVGDSFAEAMQVAEDEGITRRLESHLTAELGRPVEVLNFGCSGFSTTLEQILVREFVRTFAPDMIVCLHHFSDVSEDWSFSRNAKVQSGHVAAVPASVSNLGLGRVLDSSQLYRLARSCKRRPTSIDPSASYKQTFDAVVHDPYTADDEEAWSYSLAALGDMAIKLKHDAIPFLVVLIPIGTQVEPVDPDYARRLGFAYLAGGKRLERCGYQGKVTDFCAARGIDCLDLLPSFRAANPDGVSRLYLPRDLHWTAAGHDLAAQAVAQRLKLDLQRRKCRGDTPSR
jgi:hypothetical protein